jgi:Flp pilus assembly protein TadG
MVTVAIVALFAFAVLGIDAAVVMTTKTQLQNAADAAALAGASGLAEGSQSVARARAISFASYNSAVKTTLAPVVIASGDVTFPKSDEIKVVTHRTSATGDPLRTYFLKILGKTNTQDVTATATVQVGDICESGGLKPWAIPDRFTDTNGNGSFDVGEVYSPTSTGYKAPGDIGEQLTLKVGDPQLTSAPGQFYPVDYPPLQTGGGGCSSSSPETGASVYRTWIESWCPYAVGPGDVLQTENGNMVGPTKQGCETVIAKDPSAYWDSSTKCVKGSSFGKSPRICLVPIYDPTEPPGPGRSSVTVTKLGAFFLESVSANGQVTGRFLQTTTTGSECDASPSAGFLKAYALVK